ncbi:tyrosine-type recombinase/integrase [Streptomyces sp. NPDC006670]|uniref:tyrosine-type recombinase/integrase n=1 Tax=Streptomyces sp. NPDC006670 TaxID=3154476 RepID=UPI0033FA97D4
MDTFDHKAVDEFVRYMEAHGVGSAAQSNAFDKLATILLDAHRLGIYEVSPVVGVQHPQYSPGRAVIPTASQLASLRDQGDDSFRLFVELMSGCGLRNGEAAAVNINNIVANDAYRVTEQVNQTTKDYGPIKHRKEDEYRDVPLPHQVRQTIEWHAEKHGTIDGYLLRHPKDKTQAFQPYFFQNQWQRLRKAQALDIPDGMVIYGMRHFFASNCLSHGIAITDVAEWMGHRSIEITFKTYRHLMPGTLGQAAKLLDLGLAA